TTFACAAGGKLVAVGASITAAGSAGASPWLPVSSDAKTGCLCSKFMLSKFHYFAKGVPLSPVRGERLAQETAVKTVDRVATILRLLSSAGESGFRLSEIEIGRAHV